MSNLTVQLKTCAGAYKALIILVVLIMAWYIFNRTKYGDNYAAQDPMNQKVFDWDWLENCCSYWPISHYIAFAVLAYMYPDCEKVLFLAGVAWELFEVFMNYIFRGTLIKQPMITGGSIQYSQVWWAGSIKDILFNTLGIISGKALAALR